MGILLALAAPAQAGSPRQDLFQAWVAGPFEIRPDTADDPLATLHVPAGRWVAWAQLRVRDDWLNDATCTLHASARPVSDTHTGLSALGNAEGGDEKSFLLTVSFEAAGPGGTLRVGCRSFSPATAVDIRIVAVRAGRLTRIDLRSGASSTTGAGAPRVIQGRSGGIVHLGSAYQTIARLSLSPGRWWVRASLTVRSTAEGVDEPRNGFSCRLVLGADADAVEGSISEPEQEHDREMVALDVASDLDHAASALLRCKEAVDFDPEVLARDIRITAIGAGSLTIRNLDGEGDSVTTGSGAPQVIQAQRQGPAWVASTHWHTIGSIRVPPGRWLLTATFDARDGPYADRMACRLIVVGVAADALIAHSFGVGAAMSLMTVAGLDAPRTAWVQCKQQGSADEDVIVLYLRLSGLRV